MDLTTILNYYLIIGFIISIIVVWVNLYKETIEMIQYSWINIFGTFMFMFVITFGWVVFGFMLILDYFNLLPDCGRRRD